MKQLQNLLIFSTLILFSLPSIAQSDSTSIEVGIDGFFINNFLPLESNIGQVNNYVLHFRKTTKESRYMRMGLGGDIRGFFSEEETDLEEDRQLVEIDYLIGWGKQKELFENGRIFYGWDVAPQLLFSREKNVAGTNNQNESTDRSLTTAIQTGPSIGFQYNITERLGLYTEANYYIRFAYTDTERTVTDGNREFESNSNSWSFSERLLLPMNLVIWWKF